MNEQVIELATGQGIWAVLFLFLLAYVMRTSEKRENRILEDKNNIIKESKEREEIIRREMREREESSNEHHNKTIESLEAITKSNNKLADTVAKIENRLDQGFEEVWKKIKQ